LSIKSAARTILILWRTFSGPLLVTAPIPPPILVRLRVTFLFCMSIIPIRRIDMITSVICRVCNIYYFLKNKSEYTIFKIVKIATAIQKFIQPFISYPTPGIMRISFMIYVKSLRITPFTTNATSQKNKKKSGRESIFKTGRIVIFMAQRIIPPMIYVLRASKDV